MRMNVRNIVIAALILSLVFIYTVHINWRQKKELASYATEIDVYEKHVDELTAKLNECMDRKTQWGNQFESEKKHSAKLKADLDSAIAEARKSQADSSSQSRQSSERLTDLEGQVKLLTEVRASLERENQDLKRQRAEQLANETEALAALRGQLERALVNEKRLQDRLEATDSGSTTGPQVKVNAPAAVAASATAETATVAGNATSTATGSSNSNSSTVSTASTGANSTASPTSTTEAAAAAAAGGAPESAGRVLRPPVKINNNVKRQHRHQDDQPVAAPVVDTPM